MSLLLLKKKEVLWWTVGVVTIGLTWLTLFRWTGVSWAGQEAVAASGLIVSVELILSGVLGLLTMVVGAIVKVLYEQNKAINLNRSGVEKLRDWVNHKDEIWPLQTREMIGEHGHVWVAEVKQEIKSVRTCMNEGFEKGHERFAELREGHKDREGRLARLEEIIEELVKKVEA